MATVERSPTRRVTGRAFSLQTSVMSGHLTQVGGRSRANTGIARKGPVTRRSKLELNHLEEEQVLLLLLEAIGDGKMHERRTYCSQIKSRWRRRRRRSLPEREGVHRPQRR